MATAPTLPHVSAADYLIGGYETEWEYVDGALVPRNSGSRDHARMVAQVIELLSSHKQTITAYAGFVLSTSETKYRVPDVLCYPAGVDPDDNLARQKPPLAVIEVLSKTDPMSEMQQKCREYVQIGIHNIFIIDLANKAVLIPVGLGFSALELEHLFFEIHGQTISIPFADLFRGFPVLG